MWESIGSDFGVPSVGGTGTLVVCNSNHYGIGAWVYLVGAGYFQILGRMGITGLVVQNLGTIGNVVPGTVISQGSVVIQKSPLSGYVPVMPNDQNQFIQRGQETALTMTAGVKNEALATVTFPTEFDSAIEPIIVLTVDKDDDMDELFSVYVRDVAYNEFKIYGSNDFSGDEDVNINWIAIGLKS
jgi:hypothetical protein